MTDIIFSTATALAEAIRQKQVSAAEVLEVYLAHIAQYNPPLNAIVVLYEEQARQRAKQADEALAHGEVWGPLHGVPVTLKTVHSVGGRLSPWMGYEAYANRIPVEDSAMPAKLRQAGANIIGLTNARFFDKNIFGQTNNPWDVERNPGGSSAGSASAVAAGLSAFDIGEDSLGSILIPANLCGVFGMRATKHRVSNAGVKVIGNPSTWQPFTVSGPLARSVEDLELAMQVICGPDGRDTNVVPLPWRVATGVTLQGLRIAWSHTFPRMPIMRDIHDSIENLVAELSRLGAQTRQTMPELNYAEQQELGWQFMPMAWEELFRANNMIPQDAPPLRLDDFYKAQVQREAFVHIWEQFFTQWDVFLCPVEMRSAERHIDTELVVDGKTYDWEAVSHSTRSISPLTGLPAISIPIGLDSQGLPIGIQIIGRRWEDERLLAIAKVVSQITGGFRKPPLSFQTGVFTNRGQLMN